jgi:hypothetical protein
MQFHLDSIKRTGVRGVAQIAVYTCIMDTYDTKRLPLSV